MPHRNDQTSPFLREKFGTLLTRHREAAGYRPKQFADILGISQQRLNRYERQGALPDVPMLVEMARKLHITMDELIGYNPAYTDRDAVLGILNKAGVELRHDDQEDTFMVSLPDGRSVKTEPDCLIAYTRHAWRQTFDKLHHHLDAIFTTAFRYEFWQEYDWDMFSKDTYHNIVLIGEAECPSSDLDQRLRFFRQKRNLTQARYAELLGFKSVQTYNRYEKRGAQPSIALLANMAYALNITVNLLTGGYFPDLPEKALHYLNRMGIDFWVDNDLLYLSHPVGIEMLNDETGYEEKYETTGVEFKYGELLYYVSRAYDKTGMNIGNDLDAVFYMTFRSLFYALVGSGTPADPVTRTDIPYCLYQQVWYADPDRTFYSVYAGEAKPGNDRISEK